VAIYGRDYYGRAKYGGRQRFDMVVDPFTAEPIGFETVSLNWSEPGGEWSGFRLVRNRSGFPISEDDGVLVLDFPVGYSGSTGGEFLDTNIPGGWHYYAIFLWDVGAAVWERAAAVDVLMPYDFGSIDKVWDSVNQQRYRVNPAIYIDNLQHAPNLQLARYLEVFGWATDMLRSQAEQTLDGYDVDSVHVNRLALLAEQFGSEIEESAPAHVNRTMVRNLGFLHRKRGTLEGIREMVSLATGWEVDVTVGNNLMLSEDQANFVNPEPQWWDPSVRYVEGDRVKHVRYLFQAKATATGYAQAPPSTKTSNTWWDVDRFIEPEDDVSVARTDTGDISTWQIEGPTGFISGGTFIGRGTTDPEDGSISYSNALGFRNTTTTNNATFHLRSIPRRKTNLTSWDKSLVIESGIPVPRARKPWVEGTRYRAGDTVMYEGSPYEAKGTTETTPDNENAWERMGYDDRVRLCVSWWSKGPHNGVINTGGRRNHAIITEFDENGDFIHDTVCAPSTYANVFYDPFNTPGLLTTGRAVAVGGAWSANNLGSWGQARDDDGGYVFPPTTGRSYQLAPATGANNNLAVTYRKVPNGTRLLGLIFRWSDANNFWIATQTGLFKVVAGAARANPASGALSYSVFGDGDRMRVELDGNTIRVYKGTTLLGTATDSFNATANRHGVEVEA
jgi:hypothetical protein